MNLFSLRLRRTAMVDSGDSTPPLASPSSEPSACHLMPVQDKAAPLYVRGQGSWLWDADGRVYLDFHQGGAANSLGHSPTVLARAMAAQAEMLINPGAGLYHPGQLELARRLCQATDFDQAYFANSGSEACESAIKLARKWGALHRNGAFGIITASHGCHGRSFGAMSASGQADQERPLAPAMPGFSQVPFNDLDALCAAVDSRTVAIMLEPVQGEAGVIPATREYLLGVARLCRELGILLILDEVQTGMGRTGALLCEQRYGVHADMVILGKGLGGGVPLSALLARGSACCAEPGELAGSHHGNPMMTAAGLAVLGAVQEPGFLREVRENGEHMKLGLQRLAGRYRHGEVRGHGLLQGLHLADRSAAELVEAARIEGLLLSAAQPDVLRFTPALTVSRANIDEMLQRLSRAFARVKTRQVNQPEGLIA